MSMPLLAMVLLLLAAPCWSASTRLAFSHYALRQAEVRFELDGTDVTGTMSYGGFKPWIVVQPGQHRLDVRSASGALLDSESILLGAGSSTIAHFAGDGRSTATAHAIRFSFDPIQPILNGNGVNVVNLALPTDARTGFNQLPYVFAGFDCHRSGPVGEPDLDIPTRYPQTPYASGSHAHIESPIALSGYDPGYQAFNSCRFVIWPNALSTTPYRSEPFPAYEPGMRLTIVLSGDGSTRPLRADALVHPEQIAPVESTLPSEEHEGLWLVPERPGWLVTLSYEPSAAGFDFLALRGYLLASNSEGKPVWQRLTADKAYEVLNGRPDGAERTQESLATLYRLIPLKSGKVVLIQDLPQFTQRATVDHSEPYYELVKLLPNRPTLSTRSGE